ncbi:MAG: hypothetical protein J7604_06130 [Sporocytophaga sp.]|uniref:DUF6928 family protein n=1 Tax=Sporocytophaga sp. TaxID=2231183 RepID=UPI001B0962ED|nr:hypothetical protein [Sporocytophaga sp.]MBO9699769.1 hypothetical protein [Sporocytophaga sp.]
MGWKASAIIIHSKTETDYKSLLSELGFSNLSKIKDKTVEEVINPDENEVYIGRYKNNLIICAPDMPMNFFEETPGHAERVLIEKFPNAEICSIVLHSVVNLWGYAVIKDGQKIRSRAGSADSGTFVEFGEPLKEELDLLSKSHIAADGKRSYLFEDFPDEPMTEDQVGEEFVFEITGKYLGEQLDRCDDFLFETRLEGYRYSNIINPSSASLGKPWWKFW